MELEYVRKLVDKRIDKAFEDSFDHPDIARMVHEDMNSRIADAFRKLAYQIESTAGPIQDNLKYVASVLDGGEEIEQPLKQCPFCNTRPSYVRMDHVKVNCTNAKCVMYGIVVDTEKWNTRSEDDDDSEVDDSEVDEDDSDCTDEDHF